MRIGRILAALIFAALCATSALALGGSGGGSVSTNTSLTGNGTGGSPLGLNPLLCFVLPEYSASSTTLLVTTLNTNQIFAPMVIANTVTWSHICVYVGVADAVNKYDIGLYNSAGTLLADIGAQTLPSTTSQCFGIIANATCTGSGAPSSCCTGAGAGTCPTSVTMLPGIYRFAATGNATTAQIAANNASTGQLWTPAASVPTTGVTANGILPASIAALVIAPTSGAGAVMLSAALY